VRSWFGSKRTSVIPDSLRSAPASGMTVCGAVDRFRGLASARNKIAQQLQSLTRSRAKNLPDFIPTLAAPLTILPQLAGGNGCARPGIQASAAPERDPRAGQAGRSGPASRLRARAFRSPERRWAGRGEGEDADGRARGRTYYLDERPDGRPSPTAEKAWGKGEGTMAGCVKRRRGEERACVKEKSPVPLPRSR
jgi:hypothetical protein